MIPKKIILIIIFFLVAIYQGNLNAQESCSIPNGPPPDNPDDNYSYNLEGNMIVNNSNYVEEYPFIAIFKNGNVEKSKNLLRTIGRRNIYAEKDFNLYEF